MERVIKKINKTTKKVVKKPEKILNEIKKEIVNTSEKPSYIKNEIYDIITGYIRTNTQFIIYLRNEILFDTKNKLRKEYPIFKENEFIIGKNKYIYKGIRIELH